MDGQPSFQSQIFMCMFILLSAAQVHIEPYKEPTEHYLQLFNNLYLYSLCLLQQMFMVGYSDTEQKQNLQSTLGFSMGGLITLNFLINILVVIIAIVLRSFQIN